MSDFSPYYIALGAADYPTKYANMLAYLEASIDALEASAIGGSLPGQTGNAGKFITTDGTTAFWSNTATLPVFNGSGASIVTIDGAVNTGRGAEIALLGFGGAQPNKFLRALDGSFEIVNDDYTTPLLGLTDAGVMSVAASVTAGGTITATSGGVVASGNPGAASTGVTIGGDGSGAQARFIDPSRTADNRRAYVAMIGGALSLGFHNDAIDAAAPGLRIVGGQASGVSETQLYGTVAVLGGMTRVTGAAGSDRGVSFQTSSTTRLFVGANGNTESGSDAGSNFVVATYTDAGVFKATPLIVNRASGLTTLASLAVSGAAAVSGVMTLSNNLGVSGSITGSGGTLLSATSGTSALSLDGTANAVGAQISFFGNGAVTPNKYVRVLSGALEFVNSAYNAVLASLTDAGMLTANGFTGPLTGAASANVLKSGDTMTGSLFANAGVMVTGSAGAPSSGGIATEGGPTYSQQLWMDPSRTTNNKRLYTTWSGGVFQIGFHNDAISTAVAALTIAGGHATGVTATTLYGAVTAAGGITASLTGAASLNVLKSGDTMSGTLNAPEVGVNGAAGTDRGYFLRTAGVNRWGMIAQAGAESGGNAGSDLWIYRLTDAGAYIDAPLVINRASGRVSIAGGGLETTGTTYFGGAATAATSLTTPAVITTGADGWRMKPNSGTTSYGVIFRNDGSNFYLLKTALNDADGAWTTHRPLVLDVTNGNVNIGGTGGTSHNMGNSGANLVLSGANVYLTAVGATEHVSATNIFSTVSGPTILTGRAGSYSGNLAQLEVKDQTGSGAAMMSFHRPSAYGLMLGLDTDQAFKLGSFSFGAGVSRFVSDTSGSFLVHYRMLVGGGEISFGDNAGSGTAAVRRMSMGSDATYSLYVNKFDASGVYQTSPFLIRKSDDAYVMNGGPIVNNNLNLQGDSSNGYIRATTGALFLGSNNQYQWQIGVSGALSSTVASGGIEIGALGSANTPYVDFHSSTTSNDYDVRLIASGGSTSSGLGTLTVQAAGLTLAGALTVDNTTANNTVAVIKNTASNGVQINLQGNGAITPNKTVRLINGTFDIVNNAYSAAIFTLTDTGVLSLGSGYNGYMIAPAGNIEFGIGSSVARTTIGGDATNTFFVNRKDSGGAYLATDFTINRTTGQATFSYPFKSPGTVTFYNAAQIRLKQADSTANVATLLHSDGGAFYFLLTNSGDADGAFNALRPFTINLNSALVSVGHGFAVSDGGMTVVGGITSTSTNSTSNIHIVDTGTSGANLKLTGNGGTNPAKFIRANGGKLEFINNGYSAVIADLTDAGLFTAGGGLQSANGALITGAGLVPNSTGNGGTSLSGTSTGSQILMSDPSRAANNRRSYLAWNTGQLAFGYHDDAISTSVTAFTISGGQASGAILANFNSALRTSVRFDAYGAPSTAHQFSSCPDTSSGSKVTIADGGTYDIATGSGMLVIYDDAGTYGFSVLMTAYGTVYPILNPSSMNLNSVTSPKINVFYNAGTGKYRIQNTTGASVTLYVTSFQFRNGS